LKEADGTKTSYMFKYMFRWGVTKCLDIKYPIGYCDSVLWCMCGGYLVGSAGFFDLLTMKSNAAVAISRAALRVSS